MSKVLIIGAGPAGLTAAYELLSQSEMVPIVFEMDPYYVGGISKTVTYKGNRLDMGGHRFFSKSDKIMDWWQHMMPIYTDKENVDITYQQKEKNVSIRYQSDKSVDTTQDPEYSLLIRDRLSRIYFLKSFFDYPITLNIRTMRQLGVVRMTKIMLSYLYAKVFPLSPEKTLEDFFINRFGRELYLTFFKNYTEKVWGVSCNAIDKEWGAQRIKALSITKVITHMMRDIVRLFLDPLYRKVIRVLKGSGSLQSDYDIGQKNTETSLIQKFLYPAHGPGQMWESVAEKVISLGGEIRMGQTVIGITLTTDLSRIRGITVKDMQGIEEFVEGDYVISTMPVRELIQAMSPQPPKEVLDISSRLEYRDFITVGLLVRKTKSILGQMTDNWIYIQEEGVKLGRLQIFNNWSPYLVRDKETIWLGLEYFCNEGDDIWSMKDVALRDFAASELDHIGIIDKKNVLDGTVVRVPKAYPSYVGAYQSFDIIKKCTDEISNLFLIGRNGMHRYNNQDHSMLTAMEAVRIILHGGSKEGIWKMNSEEKYHEAK